MKLPVYLYGHPVLREVCKDVPKEYPDLTKLVEDMYETMYASEGVGLAAPQVGLPLRMVVIDGSPIADSDPGCADSKMTIINPTLTVLDGDEVTRAEGCLSLPGLSEDVRRVEHINLKYFDENWQEHEREISGFLARIVQHELDHLEGLLYIDHISGIRKQLNKAKLNNIIKGKTRCEYPVRYAPKKKH